MAKLTDLPLLAAAKLQQSVGKYAERGAAELHYARKMFEAGALRIEPRRTWWQWLPTFDGGANSA